MSLIVFFGISTVPCISTFGWFVTKIYLLRLFNTCYLPVVVKSVSRGSHIIAQCCLHMLKQGQNNNSTCSVYLTHLQLRVIFRDDEIGETQVLFKRVSEVNKYCTVDIVWFHREWATPFVFALGEAKPLFSLFIQPVS